MTVKMYLEKEKARRNVGMIQLVLGILCLLISIGLFATMEKYGLPIFALLVSVFMILSSRQTLVIE